MAVFGIFFAFTACNNEPDIPVLTGTVSINGTVKVGEQLTATVSEDSNGTAGKFTYRWTRTPESGSALEIAGANGHQYTITEADVGHILGATVSNDDTTGTISGATTAKASMADLASRNFNNKVMFVDSETNYVADIVDGRTGARYKTLEQLSIVTQLQGAVSNAFTAGNGIVKSKSRNVFGENNTNGKVTITIEDGVGYESYEVDDLANVRFNIDWLLDEELSDADLQAAITAAVAEMNDMI